MWRFDYPAHRAFVAPARPLPELWRLVAGLGVVYAFSLWAAQMAVALVYQALPTDRASTLLHEMNTGTSPAGMIGLLFLLGLLAVGAAVAVTILHRRAPGTLIGNGGLARRQFLRVSLGIIALNVVVMLLPPWDGGDMTLAMPVATWATLLPLSLVAVLVQTGSEEILFRGYIQQQIAARFAHPLVWTVVPSALFGLAHLDAGTFGDNSWTVAMWAFAFGMIASDITGRAGTLGPAIAIHFWNNCWALLVVSMQGNMSGLALFHLPFGPEDSAAVAAYLPVDFALLFLNWLVARLMLRV